MGIQEWIKKLEGLYKWRKIHPGLSDESGEVLCSAWPHAWNVLEKGAINAAETLKEIQGKNAEFGKFTVINH